MPASAGTRVVRGAAVTGFAGLAGPAARSAAIAAGIGSGMTASFESPAASAAAELSALACEASLLSEEAGGPASGPATTRPGIAVAKLLAGGVADDEAGMIGSLASAITGRLGAEDAGAGGAPSTGAVVAAGAALGAVRVGASATAVEDDAE